MLLMKNLTNTPFWLLSIMVSVSSEKYEESEYPVIRMFLFDPSIIERTTVIVGLASILNDGGAVTTSETFSSFSAVMEVLIVSVISSHSDSDNCGYCLCREIVALSVPFAISALIVFRSISLFISPFDTAHSPAL